MSQHINRFFGDDGLDNLTAGSNSSDVVTLASADGPDDVTTITSDEESQMDRQQMIEALTKLGFDTSTLTDATPDAALAEMLRLYENKDSAEAAEEVQEAKPENFDEPPADAPPADDAPPSHDEMVKALTDMGYDPADLAGKSDEDLAALLASEMNASQGAEPPQQFDEPPADPAAPPVDENAPAPTRDEMIEALVEVGYDRAELEGMPDEELADNFNQELDSHVQQMMEQGAATSFSEQTVANEDENEEAFKQLMRQIKLELVPMIRSLVVEKFSEVTEKLATTERMAKQLANNTKRANIRAFCESMRNDGRLSPGKFDETMARLMRADNSRVIKFTEKGGTKQALTDLDLQMREIRTSPAVVHFGEQLEQPNRPLATEVGKIKNHFEKFSETFKKHGTTKDALVSAFKKARAKRKGLTADQFISGARS